MGRGHYPWYIDTLPMIYLPPIHGILITLLMVIATPTHYRYAMGTGVDIPLVGGRYIIDRGSIYQGQWGRYTMSSGFDMPWIGCQNTMGRGSIYYV
jgi:hypothetical protein